MPSAGSDLQDVKWIATAMLDGEVVPVLGAGANLCDRAAGAAWTQGADLPDGSELADWLATQLQCDIVERHDLLRVSQYAKVTRGPGPMYKRLHKLFDDDDYPIPTVHRFLAGLPGRMKAGGMQPCYQLIVTTNYDNLMERALRAEREPFDVVRYFAGGDRPGRFVHDRSDAGGDQPAGEVAPVVIKEPKKYLEVSTDARTVVLKIHGGFDRRGADHDSYVITEDDYIDYLTQTSPSALIPANLLRTLTNSSFLFLGYAMRDWNLRVLLHRIWGLRAQGWQSWAVQRDVSEFDEKMWGERDVKLRQALLSDYIAELSGYVDAATGT
ncbi:MAG: SIR2 family protein [Solirubrobacteraceae bacterium]|jgi:hypothetical protein